MFFLFQGSPSRYPGIERAKRRLSEGPDSRESPSLPLSTQGPPWALLLFRGNSGNFLNRVISNLSVALSTMKRFLRAFAYYGENYIEEEKPSVETHPESILKKSLVI